MSSAARGRARAAAKATSRRRPKKLIDRPFTDPVIARAIAEQELIEIAENQKVTRSILEAGLDPVPPTKTQIHWIEDRLTGADARSEPMPAPAPLLPERWWEYAAAAMESRRPDPTLVVSPQVAQVLNMGIDRAVDVASRREEQLRETEHLLARYRYAHDRLVGFCQNIVTKFGDRSVGLELLGEIHKAAQRVLEEDKP